MAANKVLALRPLPFLAASTCWSVPARNYANQRTILKKMGYPEKPKKPPTSFIFYIGDQRAAFLSQNPNMSFKELTQLMAKRWNELPENEKKKYEDEYQKKKKEYNAKMETYNKQLTDQQKKEMKQLLAGYEMSQKEKLVRNELKKLEKELKKPKSPVSPFVVYFAKHLNNYEGSGASRLKEIGEQWKNAPESEKQKYRALYNKEVEQYKKDLKKWEEQMLQEGNVDVIRLKTLKEKLQNSTFRE